MRCLANAIAAVLVLPLRLLHSAGIVTFVGIAHLLAPLPGQLGRFVRRAWYSRELAYCGRNLVVDFGAAIRTPQTRIGDDCYIGIYNWVGLADIGDDFMSGSHVVILSGGRTHRFSDLTRPMRMQGTEMARITIGDDVWVGAQASIMSDVAAHSIVATGGIVTKCFAEYDILAGVPAAPIGSRRAGLTPGD